MKTVFISGASRGIGKALAQKFLANNFFVIGTSTKGCADFEHENFVMLQLEQTDCTSIENCAREVAGLEKKIDILINNAGTWIEGDYATMINSDVLKKTLEINLMGPINLTEKMIPFLNKNAHVINVSSRKGSLSHKIIIDGPCYGISKAGINLFTKYLAQRLEGCVTVSAVHPGYVKTEMNEGGGDVTPDEAAAEIYKLALSNVETGKFWFNGEEFPW